MEISLSTIDLKNYVKAQCDRFFPDNYELWGSDVDKAFDMALMRSEWCFCHILMRGFRTSKGNTFFNHLHSDQYAMFLYFFSNSLWNYSQNTAISDKLNYLNKALHGFFISYRHKYPDIFLLSHPVGTVLGDVDAGDGLVILQNCSIEGSGGGKPTKLGKGVFLGAGAKILGKCIIGDRVSIGSGTTCYNLCVPNDMVVTSENGKTEIRKRRKHNYRTHDIFDIEF